MQTRCAGRDKRRAQLSRPQRGVILLETLVAVAILSTAVLASLVAVSTTSIATEKVSEDATSSWLATSQIELIRESPYVSTGGTYPVVTAPAGYTVSNQTSVFPGGDDFIQNVTVTIVYGGETIYEETVVKVNR